MNDERIYFSGTEFDTILAVKHLIDRRIEFNGILPLNRLLNGSGSLILSGFEPESERLEHINSRTED